MKQSIQNYSDTLINLHDLRWRKFRNKRSWKTNEFVRNQIKKAFKGISKENAIKTIVAYEPIWAIGTGKTATPQDANDTIKSIRQTLQELYGSSVSEKLEYFTADL